MESSRSPTRQVLLSANWNAGLWAVGNGLVSTTLVTFLALELGAEGVVVSAILAAPRFTGALRLLTPLLVARVGNLRRCCIAGYLMSGMVLALLPLSAAPGYLLREGSMAALVTAWCGYHLLEGIATVALWSWLGEWIPARLRGRLISRRERWLVTGRLVGIAASVLLALFWEWLVGQAAGASPIDRWQPLAWSALVGAGLLAVAALPLLAIPARSVKRGSPSPVWRSVRRVLNHLRYRRLLLFSCGLAAANGVTSVAQSMYVNRVLGISYSEIIGLRSMMFSGQSLLAQPVGEVVDRWGAKRVLRLSHGIVATAPIFFWLAAPAAEWWIVGAYAAWIAYVGLNVGLDSLKLQLAPTMNRPPYIAVYHAMSDLVSGIALMGMSGCYEMLRHNPSDARQLYASIFLWGGVAHLLVARLAQRIEVTRPKIHPARC